MKLHAKLFHQKIWQNYGQQHHVGASEKANSCIAFLLFNRAMGGGDNCSNMMVEREAFSCKSRCGQAHPGCLIRVTQ